MKRLILSILCPLFLQATQLNKAFVHQVPLGQTLQETPHLELIKAVLYFSEKPVVHQLEHVDQTSNGRKHETLFFACDEIMPAAKKNLTDMRLETPYYQIVCTEVDEPKKGVRIEIWHDPHNILFVKESFDAITSDKGTVLRFINKALLDDMQLVNKPLLQTACNNAQRIVIDPGHGGHDAGAVGHNGIKEKDIALDIGLKTAHCLRKLGYEVLLTREADTYISLASRTGMINTFRPDAYISVHVNSSANKSAQGIETYSLQAQLFTPYGQMSVAERAAKEVVHGKYKKSLELAEKVHGEILAALSAHSVQDRCVKPAVSQILLGTNAPGILVEVGFITHPCEAERLVLAGYQDRIAQGMCNGLTAFLHA